MLSFLRIAQTEAIILAVGVIILYVIIKLLLRIIKKIRR